MLIGDNCFCIPSGTKVEKARKQMSQNKRHENGCDLLEICMQLGKGDGITLIVQRLPARVSIRAEMHVA